MTNNRSGQQQNPSTSFKRRSSFEIANDFVEFNFKPIIQADREAGLSKRQIRKLRKIEEARRAKSAERRKRRYIRNSIVASIVMVFGAVAIAILWWNSSTAPVDISKKDVRQFMVDEGTSASQVAESLRKVGFIRNEFAFTLYVKLTSSVIQAGTHMLSPSYTMQEIVRNLTIGNTDEVEVTIPPGLSLKDLTAQLKSYNYTDEQIDKALKMNYDFDILKDRPAGATLEGYLYPDTYRVLGGNGPEVVIEKALTQFETVAKANKLEEGFKAHGLSMYQGITLASIVTKEVLSEADQRKVAGVFYNRLQNNMNLGSDVTYQYAFKQGLCTENTPSGCESDYNTRIHSGLPPGPIANPSLTALRAVANPEDSNYLFFVAGDDGATYFSETADQHNQAIAEHCTKLCE